jgi:hypothetical protein
MLCASLIALLALGSVACTGDGADEAASKASFADAYGAIVDDYERAAEEIKDRAALVSDSGLDPIVGVYEEILDSTEAAFDDLSDLRPPSDLASAYDELLEVLGRQVDALSELVAAAEDRDIASVSIAAGRLTDLSSEWNSLRQEMDQLLKG